MSFTLDPRLEAASAFVCDLPLCQVRLQDDVRWPWLVLVPRRHGLREIEELDLDDRGRLLDEAMRAGAVVRRLGRADKLNIAALGNVVAQLHVHVVGRHEGDEAWPDPVWGRGDPIRYDGRQRERLIGLAAELLRG